MTQSQGGQSRKVDLKELRQTRAATVTATQRLLKEQQATRKLINAEISSQARTVPDISQAIGLPAGQVLWHLMAMKKYGLIEESGMEGQYYLYETAKE
jgi:predicted transcriptional regulator